MLKGLIGAAVIAGAVAAAQADVVTDWVEQVNQAIRVNGGPPCPIGRAIAITEIAVFEGVNSIDRAFDPYIHYLDVTRPVNKAAAIAQAAHDALVSLYPAQQSTFDTALAASLISIPNGAAKTNGINLGARSAAQILAARANDGSNNPITYVFGTRPGDYRTPEDINVTTPFNPEWGNVTPFCLDFGAQFRPPGPLGFSHPAALLRSAGYAAQVNEVKSIGSRNSVTRTALQTKIAFFWANDVNGTYKPPGHLLHITEEIIAGRGLSLVEEARLFAMLGLAMGDAGLVAWDCKYKTDVDLWRPITAIRNADIDNNPATTKDANWLPLNTFTPPFPAYISGHATFGASHAAVLTEFFGTDAIDYTITSEDPFLAQIDPSFTRTFHSLAASARENGLSRVYLGVHFRFDADQGFAAGTSIGHHIGRHFFRLRCPADFDQNGRVNTSDSAAFTVAFFNNDAAADFNHDGTVNITDMSRFYDAYLTPCP